MLKSIRSRAARPVIALAALVSVCMISISHAAVMVTVERLGAEPLTGHWISGSAQQVVIETASQTRQTLLVETIAGMQVGDSKLRVIAPISGSGWTVLASGERLRALPSVIDADSLTVSLTQLPALPSQRVPLEACRGFTLSLPSDPFRQGLDWRRLMQRSDESDLILLKNGDRVDGEFLGLADAKFRTKTSLGEVVSDFNAVRSLALNPTLITTPKRPPRFVWAVLTEGSVLCLEELTMKGEFCIAKSVSGFALKLPTIALAELRFVHEQVQSLADRKPDEVAQQKLLGTNRPPLTNMNVIGGPLLIGGVPFATGYGVPAGTRLSWDLQPKDQSFSAVVGVDDSAGAGGTVEFEIIVDGREVWRSPKLHGRDGPLRTPTISVSGAKRLSLVTHPADLGAVLDFADWCHPTLHQARR